jgi:hypothetical protein
MNIKISPHVALSTLTQRFPIECSKTLSPCSTTNCFPFSSTSLYQEADEALPGTPHSRKCISPPPPLSRSVSLHPLSLLKALMPHFLNFVHARHVIGVFTDSRVPRNDDKRLLPTSSLRHLLGGACCT